MNVNIEIVASYIYFDMPPEQEIAAIAEQLIRQGIESNCLADLAAGVYELGIKDAIKEVFKELGIDLPTHEEAGFLLAKYYASKIIDGSLSPYEGARKIWMEVEVNEENKYEFEPLRVFAGLASEYEDFSEEDRLEFYGKEECVNKQAEIDKVIIEEAKILLDRC